MANAAPPASREMVAFHDWLVAEWREAVRTLFHAIEGAAIYHHDPDEGDRVVTADNFARYMYDLDDLDQSDGTVDAARWTAGRLWQLREAIEQLYRRFPDMPDQVNLYDPSPVLGEE